MAMIESEVEALAKAVGDVDWSDPQVEAWRVANLAQQRINEKQFRAAFTIAKMMRQDERMKEMANAVEETRKLIAILEGLKPSDEKILKHIMESKE